MLIKTVFLFFWFFSFIKTLLFHTYFWQLKEYRFDRLIAHLGLKVGKKIIFSFSSLVKWILLIGLLLTIEKLTIKQETLLIYLILGLFLYEFFSLIRQVFLRHFVHPRFTLRITEIFLGTFLFEILIIFWLVTRNVNLIVFILGLLVLERLIFLIVPLNVLVTKVPVFISKERKYQKAKEKLEKIKNLKVIAVTGSYGKTSTKDFIAQILGEEYRVVKTKGTNNTKIGVAQNIINQLKTNTEILVVEMGAYKKGEIAKICQLVQPDIAVTTGINEQHLSLFGSLKNLIEAKYEIIEALPEEGMAVFNSDNRYCQAMAKKASRKYKTILYQIGRPRNLKGIKKIYWADSIREEKDKLSFKVYFDRKDKKGTDFEINLTGRQNVANLIAGIAIARELKVEPAKIVKAVKKIKPSIHGLKSVEGVEGISFINDTFSSNPHGFLAAIRYLKSFKSKTKVIITPGIIELGSATNQVHQKIGRLMGQSVDWVILTNDNFLVEVKKGMGQKKGKLLVEDKPEKILSFLRKVKPKPVVLLEGRLPVNILNSFEIL